VRIVCDVDANPPAGLFRWSFNNSAVQSEEVDSETEPGGGRSVARYKPQSERDYGTLLCWGRNELGSQVIPCVFHVVPAGNRPSHYQYDNQLCTQLFSFLVHVVLKGNKAKCDIHKATICTVCLSYFQSILFVQVTESDIIPYNRATQPIAPVPKMACCLHCSLYFFYYYFCPTSFSVL